MLEETLIQLGQGGGIALAVFILWDSNKKIANAMNEIAESIRSCPYKQKAERYNNGRSRR